MLDGAICHLIPVGRGGGLFGDFVFENFLKIFPFNDLIITLCVFISRTFKNLIEEI